DRERTAEGRDGRFDLQHAGTHDNNGEKGCDKCKARNTPRPQCKLRHRLGVDVTAVHYLSHWAEQMVLSAAHSFWSSSGLLGPDAAIASIAATRPRVSG